MTKYFIYLLFIILSSCTYKSLEDITVDCDEFPISIETVVSEADCGLNNGSVTIIPSGGTAPFRYILNGVQQENNVIQMLAAGNYTIEVIDVNNCSEQSDFVVLNNDGVNANAIASPSGCNTTIGILTVSAVNGIPPYQYSIENGAAQSSNIFNNLATGSHNITVIDNNNCSFEFEKFVPTGISYSQSVEVIIADNCAVSGCHNGTQFPNFTKFENIQSNKNNIKTRTQNKSMPTGGGSLTQEKIDMIACWVDDGGLNN